MSATSSPLTRAPAAAVAALLLAGCAVTSDYHAPAVQTPAAFRNAGARAAEVDAAWWARFNDPVLNALVARAAEANLDLAQASARVRQARAQVQVAHARGAPQINGQGQASATRLSENSSIAQIAQNLPSGGAVGLPGSTIQTYQVGLDASWEADLFGGDRRSVEAAKARVSAADWSARDVQVSLAGEVANAYFRYRTAQGRLALLDQRAAAQAESVATTAVRVRGGLTTSIDQRRAEQRLAQTAAARDALVADREAQLQALTVLIGEPADQIEQRLTPAGVELLPEVPAGLPADLLRRRPDIRVAERRLAASTADIGVAVADLYPKLTLTGGLDLVSSSLGSLFSSDSLQPTAAAKLMFPLFDGGGRRGTVKVREAQRDEAYAAYQQVVLTALRDVEIALSRLAADRKRLASLTQAEAEARDAYDTAGVQNRAGLTTGLDLLTLQDEWLAARDAVAQARSQARLDIVAVNRALGGGWSDQKIKTP